MDSPGKIHKRVALLLQATSVAVQSSAVHESGVPTNIAAPLIQYAKGGFGVVKARTGSVHFFHATSSLSFLINSWI